MSLYKYFHIKALGKNDSTSIAQDFEKIAAEECEFSPKGKRKHGRNHQQKPVFRYKVTKPSAEFGNAAAKKKNFMKLQSEISGDKTTQC